MSALNPRTTTFEWNGPMGAFLTIGLLPLVVISMNVLCGERSCNVADVKILPQLIRSGIAGAWPLVPTAIFWECLWLLFHAVLYLAPWGARVQGQKLRTGETLTYNINAFHAYVICHAGAFAGHYFGYFDLGILTDMFLPLAIGAIIISAIMSVLLYVASFRSSNVVLALGGNSGYPFYDFWVGRELNPRIGNLDLKFMCELRPGLIGWSLINWAFVARSISKGGALNVELLAVSLMEGWYVLEALYFEDGNLTMMDIVHDGFGFMLAFGDHAWVPFLYTLQAKFLFYNRQTRPWVLWVAIVLHVVGYLLFRGANLDKDRFRKNPSDPRVAHLKTMSTSAGKKLIISGFWGVCRHPNYVGDLMMTIGWSLLTGVDTVLPYFHPIYFAILLIHRQLRDEEQMLHKYGPEDWKRYCTHVPYRLIPYVY